MGHTSPVVARPGSRIVVAIAAVLGALVVAVPIVGAVSLQLPKGITEPHAQRMYTEQVDSAVALDELVNGDMKTFEVTKRTVTGNRAALELKVTYQTGVTRAGRMRLTKINGKWYFAMITRAGRDEVGSELITNPDVGVLNTMLEEQSVHSTMTAGLVNGTYNKVDVGTPQEGYRSVVLPLTFSGTKTKKGEATCIKRTEAGRDQWFVVSFSEK